MNKYLEKIAGLGSSIGNLALDVGKAGASALGKGIKSYGQQIHKATGGAHMDYAISKGITDPNTLAQINGSKAGRVALSKALRKTPEFKQSLKDLPKKEALKQHAKNMYGKNGDFARLQAEQRTARINAAGVTAVGLYGGHKLKSKIEEIKNRNTTQYQY